MPPARSSQFSVTDTGVGISEHNLEVIFGAFQQGDGTTSRRYGGTGLGLAICRELAAQLGGRITARERSRRGQHVHAVPAGPASRPPRSASRPPGRLGSWHRTVRPRAGSAGLAGWRAAWQPGRAERRVGPEPAGSPPDPPAGQRNRRPQTPPGAHDSLHGKKVLIVDDDLRNAFAITSILELYGMTVLHAPDGRTGIEMLRATPGIDIVLMDVMMPELDGYATTGAIREIPELDGLPVIAVTARAMHGDRDKSIAAGANDYVTKPVDTEELLSCMERWIRPRRSAD